MTALPVPKIRDERQLAPLVASGGTRIHPPFRSRTLEDALQTWCQLLFSDKIPIQALTNSLRIVSGIGAVSILVPTFLSAAHQN
jgi:hypothetical protein